MKLNSRGMDARRQVYKSGKQNCVLFCWREIHEYSKVGAGNNGERREVGRGRQAGRWGVGEGVEAGRRKEESQGGSQAEMGEVG